MTPVDNVMSIDKTEEQESEEYLRKGGQVLH